MEQKGCMSSGSSALSLPSGDLMVSISDIFEIFTTKLLELLVKLQILSSQTSCSWMLEISHLSWSYITMSRGETKEKSNLLVDLIDKIVRLRFCYWWCDIQISKMKNTEMEENYFSSLLSIFLFFLSNHFLVFFFSFFYYFFLPRIVHYNEALIPSSQSYLYRKPQITWK